MRLNNLPLKIEYKFLENQLTRSFNAEIYTDGAVIGGRIQVILDDILWIATLPQVRSAIAFYSHIMSVIKAAPKKIGQNLQVFILSCNVWRN